MHTDTETHTHTYTIKKQQGKFPSKENLYRKVISVFLFSSHYEKPEKPVLPGETGFIKVVFNSSGKKGHNEKDVNVSSNANPSFPAS